MKNIKILSLIIFFLLPLPLFAKSSGLDETIASMSQSVIDSVSGRTTIAILDFKADTEKLGSYIKDKLTSDIMEKDRNKKVKIVSRDELGKLEKETDFQYSGYVDDTTAVSLCAKLGAEALVVGKIEELGDEFTLTVKMPTVETAEYLFFKTYSVSNDKKIKNLLKDNEKKEKTVSSGTKISQKKEKNRGFDRQVNSFHIKDVDDDGEVSSKSLAFSLEGNGYSISGVAPCGAIDFNYDFSEKIAFGARFGFAYDVSSKDVSVFTIEPLLTARFYPFHASGLFFENIFLEAQFGLALANVDGEFHMETKHGDFNKYIFCAVGEVGWRCYLKFFDLPNWYVEPYIRAGTPFLFGAGISFGKKF